MKTTANVGETESRHYRIWLTPIKKRQLNKASEVKSLGCQVTRTLEIQKQNLRKNQSHSRLFVGGSFLILGEMIKGTIHPPKTNDPTSPPKKEGHVPKRTRLPSTIFSADELLTLPTCTYSRVSQVGT